MNNYYDILLIPIDASPLIIRKAYKKLALKYHPDKNDLDTTDTFYEISKAYQVLSNPLLRRQYDSDNTTKDMDIPYLDPNIIFNNLFNSFDPILSNYFKQTLVDLGESVFDKNNKDLSECVGSFFEDSFIDKTSNVIKNFIKHKTRVETTYIFKLDEGELINNPSDEFSIDIGLDFMRKYSNINLIISNSTLTKDFLLDLKYNEFNIRFNDQPHKLVIYNDFPDNLYRKPNCADLHLITQLHLENYLGGFLFELRLTETYMISTNIILFDENTVCIPRFGLYNTATTHGDLYITFRPDLISTILPDIRKGTPIISSIKIK
tara:strand:+ start:333 stop:1292 length:960 start_codon:yes stop_codon:yes gene_type:complete